MKGNLLNEKTKLENLLAENERNANLKNTTAKN